MRSFFVAMLIALPGPVVAQAPATPASQPPERSTSGENRLNLNLDESSRRQILRELPSERGANRDEANGLPGLGAKPRKAEPTSDMGDKRPFPNSGLDPAPTAPLPR